MTAESNNSLMLGDLMDIFEDISDYIEGLNTSANGTIIFVPDPSTFICEPISVSRSVSTAVCIFYTLIFLLAIPGNFVVWLVIGSDRKPLSPSQLYLRHLAAADGLLALTLPLWATAAVSGWAFGDAACKLASLALEASFYSSILLLACISVDRYHMVVHAAESRNNMRRRRGSWLTCAAVWALGAVLSLPALLKGVVRPNGATWVVCEENYSPDAAAAWRLATRLLRHALGFLLPLAVMLTCYGAAAARLLRTRGQRGRRARRLIAAVVAAFLLCWAPHHLAVAVDTLQRARLVPHGCAARQAVGMAVFATQILGLLHSAVNPVLYAFVSQNFRSRMQRRLCGGPGPEREAAPRGSRSTSQNSDGISTAL